MKKAGNEEVLNRIGKNIQELRKGQKLTQKQLAFECGLEVRQIRRIEKGEHNSGILHLKLIADILDVELVQIVQGIKKDKKEI